jgi:hypothetical protein
MPQLELSGNQTSRDDTRMRYARLTLNIIRSLLEKNIDFR